MTFFVPSKWAGARHPGQVPTHDRVERNEIMKLVDKPAPRFSVDRLFERPVMSPGAAVEDLGLSKADQSSWTKFLGDVVGSATYEPTVRQQVMERLMQEAWDPSLRKVVLQRSVSLFRSMQKAAVLSVDELRKAQRVTPEQYLRLSNQARATTFYLMSKVQRAKLHEGLLEIRGKLEKADAKGGLYHRRVPKKGGGYRYYYNEDSYNRSKDAHHHGPDMRAQAMGNDVTKAATDAGHEGCDVKTMRRLAQKYGRAELGEHLKAQCKKGRLVYKGKRFYLGKGK